MNNLGPGYIVWDRAAKIDFIKPGKTELTAEFRIEEELLSLIKSKTDSGDKYIFDLPVSIYDSNKELIAKVEKTLYVRKKPPKNTESS
jgi:acyl-coenzyme A thioesterase PaaI-like protein